MAKRRGNPNFHRVSTPVLRKAFLRHERMLMREAVDIYHDPEFSPRTHVGVATELLRRGRFTWRGRPISAQKVGQLVTQLIKTPTGETVARKLGIRIERWLDNSRPPPDVPSGSIAASTAETSWSAMHPRHPAFIRPPTMHFPVSIPP